MNCAFCGRKLRTLDPEDWDDGHLVHWPTQQLICSPCAYPELYPKESPCTELNPNTPLLPQP